MFECQLWRSTAKLFQQFYCLNQCIQRVELYSKNYMIFPMCLKYWPKLVPYILVLQHILKELLPLEEKPEYGLV